MKANNKHDRVRAGLRVENLEDRRLFAVGGGAMVIDQGSPIIDHARQFREWPVQVGAPTNYFLPPKPHVTNVTTVTPLRIVTHEQPPVSPLVRYPIVIATPGPSPELINFRSRAGNPNMPMLS